MSGKTKIFGFQIPVSQNVLAAVLVCSVVAIGLYNFLGHGDTPSNVSRSGIRPVASASSPSPNVNGSRRSDRRRQGTLRLRPVDPSAVIDPTLKLGLLDRVRSVELVAGGRNLFEIGAQMTAAKLPPVPVVAKMTPKPIGPLGPMPPPPIQAPHVNVPFRYYGFVRPTLRGDGNRGYFMDGDTILMATEGDVLKGHFLVVALSPNTARIEDIQLKQGQDLQLIPEAVVTTP